MRYRLRLDRLEQLLAGSRVSQNHWAMRLGLSRGHWSDVRAGRHPYPSARTRQRMLEVFGVAERDLFEPDAPSRSDDFDFRLALAARFEVTSELGQGGMGTVYLANDLTLSRIVAVKMVADEAVAGIGVDQLLKEIALVSRLQHPNVLPLFDAGERAGSPFYVMPWVRGGSLAALLESRARLPLGEVSTLVDGIAAALTFAHEHGVLHCDVKPANVLVQGLHPYVMDFGIARRLHSEANEWLSLRKELDFSAGTPAYVSPEQASGDPNLDARSDVYSLACMTYEMLAGRPPFTGETTQQIVSLRFHESPPPLQRFAPEVPVAVSEVIARAMAIDPAERPASAADFAGDLRAASSTDARRSALSVLARRAVRRVRAVAAGPPTTMERPMPLREWLVSLRQDVVIAMRQRRRAPGLALMAVLTLALGIGLTTAVFAVLNGVLFQPLPYPEPERLVSLQSVDSMGGPVFRVSSANWADWNDQNRTLESSAMHQSGRVSLLVNGEALRADVQSVTSDFFDVLQARFVAGRSFTDDDVADRRLVVILTEGFWRSTLGGQPIENVRIQVNGFEPAVVGVVSSHHVYPEGTDFYALERPRRVGGPERNNINYEAIGRLTSGVPIEAAITDLSTIARRIQADEPQSLYSHGVIVMPLSEYLVGDTSGTLTLLMGAVALVLLIACANLASANLAQGAVRRREMAVRAALGAGATRLVRQVLVDHALVAMAGGALGVFLAWFLTRSATWLGAGFLPRAGDVRIDVWVLLFALGVAAFAGIATGLLPAIRASRAAPGSAMEGGTRGHVAGGRGIPGRVLVAAEIAMALMLVIGAGLLVQSLRGVLARPLGYETENVVLAEVTLSGPRYARDSVPVMDYWNRLRQSLSEIPGARGAGLINWAPLVRGGTGGVEIAGKDVPSASAGYRVVSEGYFGALGISLLEGRDFESTDRVDGPRVTVVSREMAERYWPGESPIGRQVRARDMERGFGGEGQAPLLTVIGVVGDARLFGYEGDLRPDMYVLYRQLPSWRVSTMTAVVRGSGTASELMGAVRSRQNAVDPGVPADFEFMSTYADRVTSWRRFTMGTLTVFGVLALVLAAIGVYGVLSFAIAQRTREMAVRAALGADRGRLQRLVLGSGARVVAVGLVAGLVGAYYLSQLAQALLFEVEARDPFIFGTSALVIAAVGVLAAAIPARRAARVEPMEALRTD
jgi:predicted permease